MTLECSVHPPLDPPSPLLTRGLGDFTATVDTFDFGFYVHGPIL
jgi:hypothetical protein